MLETTKSVAPIEAGSCEVNSEVTKNAVPTKANIIDHPRHQKSMNKWLAISSEFHKSFEEMVKAKNHHKLNLDQYYIPIKNIKKTNNKLADQLHELNELYKTGVLTKEEFKKAKKKILN